MRKYCTKCGKEMSQDDKFCGCCGTEISPINKCINEHYNNNRIYYIIRIFFWIPFIVIFAGQLFGIESIMYLGRFMLWFYIIFLLSWYFCFERRKVNKSIGNNIGIVVWISITLIALGILLKSEMVLKNFFIVTN